MKKILTLAFALLAAVGSMQAQEVIQLPQPNIKSLKLSLGKALQQRRSNREYNSEREISRQQLATILWAAVGINDEKTGKLTSPTAVNMQDIKVYVCDATGAWRFDAKDNTLTKVSAEDLRQPIADRQAFAQQAPLSLLLVSSQGGSRRPSERFGAMDAGYVSQNIYLACAALGLKTVARATMDQEALKKALGLKDMDYLMLNHPVAYGK